MVEITDEFMRERLSRMRGWTTLLLKAGPNYQPQATRSPEQAAIVREHGRRNMQLQVDGKVALVGPLHNAFPIVGLCVFTVAEAEARELMAGDPALQAGLFTLDFATWFGAPGDSLPA